MAGNSLQSDMVLMESGGDGEFVLKGGSAETIFRQFNLNGVAWDGHEDTFEIWQTIAFID